MGKRIVLFVGLIVGSWALAPPAHAVDDQDCGDFPSQEAAQQHLREDPSDPDGLDGNDHDGIACEDRPAPRDENPVFVSSGTAAPTPTTQSAAAAPSPTAAAAASVANTGSNHAAPLTAAGLTLVLLGWALVRTGWGPMMRLSPAGTRARHLMDDALGSGWDNRA